MSQPLRLQMERPRAGPAPAAESTDGPPYHVFLLTSIAFAVGSGFMLATLVPLSIVLKWDWRPSTLALVQAHGQAQVLGWVGLFIMGMGYRLMPRFSGRPLRFPPLAWVSWSALAVALVLRLVAQPGGSGLSQEVALIVSGALGVVSAVAFALVVWGTLCHRESRAGATGYFFLLGSAAFVAQAGMSLALLALMAERGESLVRPLEAAGLLHLQLYGFIAMLVLGVALRAVPTFSGVPRPEAQAKALALVLAGVVTAYVVGAVWVATGGGNASLYRLEAVSLAALGPVFLAATWMVGIFRPAAIRVRAASQPHLWFIRSAFAWLVVAAGLAAYYGVRAAADGTPPVFYGLDAVRHTLGVGVATMMILGMAMLVIPEFAIRRMRYPGELGLPLLMAGLLNASAALRVAAAVATPQLLGTDRYWPMAVAGGLAEVAVMVFGGLFVWGMLNKRSIVESQVPVRAQG